MQLAYSRQLDEGHLHAYGLGHTYVFLTAAMIANLHSFTRLHTTVSCGTALYVCVSSSMSQGPCIQFKPGFVAAGTAAG